MWGFLFVILLTASSYYFLDTRIALFVYKILLSDARLNFLSADVPDILFLIVCFITLTALSVYFYLTHRGMYNVHARFFLLVACSNPVTYFLKTILKHAVGRIETRYWLLHPTAQEFQWFHGQRNFASFPSGHMAISAALMAALWEYYPRYRQAYIGFLVAAALALITTDYHFLSDIIAGAYLGAVVHMGTLNGLRVLAILPERNERFE